ncbi:MAG: hypothetical protein HXX13_18405 [Bacteroidetes bacterium]|nr:hypothetical protein [Bacteroidota bacterium]
MKTMLAFLLMLIVCSSMLKAQNKFRADFDCKQQQITDSMLFRRFISSDLSFESYKDSLVGFQSAYGKNKQFEGLSQDAALTALSFYPELSDTRIHFKYRPIAWTMNARPAVSNLFHSGEKDNFLVLINNNEGKHKGLSYDSLSFNIQVGFFAHEFAHILEYKEMNDLKAMRFSVRYMLFPNFKKKVERYTDYLATKHRLANPMFERVESVLNNPYASETYKNRIRRFYLSPDEIFCIWLSNTNQGNRLVK